MTNYELIASSRDEIGKGPSRRLRVSGNIPAEMYGYKGNRHVAIKKSDFESVFTKIGEHSIITLVIDGKEKRDVIVKDYQLDPIKKNLIHLDFLEIEKGKTLRTEVPIQVVGTSVGVKKGGILETFVHEIEIECLPKDIPDHVEVDVANLDIGDSLHVNDLDVGSNIKVLSNPEQVVLTVGMPTKIAAPVEEVEEEVEEEVTEEEKTE